MAAHGLIQGFARGGDDLLPILAGGLFLKVSGHHGDLAWISGVAQRADEGFGGFGTANLFEGLK